MSGAGDMTGTVTGARRGGRRRRSSGASRTEAGSGRYVRRQPGEEAAPALPGGGDRGT